MNWEMIKLGDLSEEVETCNPQELFKNSYFTYIDISAINSNHKNVEGAKRILSANSPSRARQIVVDGDVLISTVRPNLNAVALINNGLNGSVASSGFCVLRPRKEIIDNKYLFYWVQTQEFVNRIVKKATGASYPAVSDSIIKNEKIPLPSYNTQKRIATILEKANELLKKEHQLYAKYDQLLQSIFFDMFGDPVRNEKGWEVKRLGEISSKILSGNTPKGGSEVYVDDGIMFFRSQNVWKNDLVYDDIAFIDKETHVKMKNSSLKRMDILMTKTGRINTENSSLGRAALFLGQDDTANVNGHVYLIRLKSANIHEFILTILTSIEYRGYIRRVCVGGIDKRQLNKEHIEEFPIIFPPINLQKRFATIAKNLQRQKILVKKQVEQSESLFQGLLQKAFNAEFVNDLNFNDY